MKWYEGAISDAITASRERRALFVVVVLHPAESENEQSKLMARLWEDLDEELFLHAMLAIRIFYGTEPARQFAEIYPVAIVPASYVIDLHGKPLDVITMKEEMNDVIFARRLRTAIELVSVGKGAEACSSSSIAEVVTAAPPSTATASGDSAPPDSTPVAPTNASPAITVEEKALRARELLRQKHLVDEESKKQKEREKELERRNTGKLMSEAKAARDEREIRELAEKRRRDKIETEREMKRLREQIKADREDRMKRQANSQIHASGADLAAKPAVVLPQPIPSSECRMQVKFADGSTLVRQFLSSESLSRLVEYVKKDGRQGSDFYLVEMYPRREFPDTTKSFLELGLTPSATLLAVSKRSSRAVVPSGTLGLLGWLQFALNASLQTFYRILQSFFGYGAGRGTKPNASEHVATEPVSATNAVPADHSRETRTTSWQEGNVHRFRNDEDSSSQNSDDEARWNGNSTQQL